MKTEFSIADGILLGMVIVKTGKVTGLVLPNTLRVGNLPLPMRGKWLMVNLMGKGH
jgi:hypothetical protein